MPEYYCRSGPSHIEALLDEHMPALVDRLRGAAIRVITESSSTACACNRKGQVPAVPATGLGMKISKLKGALDHAIENAPEGNELKKTLERAKLEPAGTAKSRHNDMLSSVQAAITSNEKAVIEYEDQPDLLAHNLLFLRQRLNFGGNALGWFSTESKITWTVNTPTVNTAKLPPSVGRKLGELLIEGGPKEGTPNLHGREDSSCLERVVCPLFRSFQLTLLEDDDDGGGLIVDRPLVCEPCQCWPLCFTQSQRLLVKDLKGNLLGQAIEPAPLCCGFYTSSRNAAAVGGGAFAPCTRVYVAQDARGEALYTLKASQCFGPNAWAPSVCNESFDVDVYDWRTGECQSSAAQAPSRLMRAHTHTRSAAPCHTPRHRSDRDRARPALHASVRSVQANILA